MREKKAEERAPKRSPWEKPSIAFLGDVKSLVRGHGKTGPNFDSDPNNTAKSGVG
jgi:hypothetical protein